MTRTLLVFAVSLSASAQIVSFGGKIGAPLRDPVNSRSFYSSVENGRWSGGPTIEVHLPLRFSVEVDALYHGYRESFAFSGQFGTPSGDSVPAIFSSASQTKSWEVPLLIKYRFTNGPIRPFVSAGVSLTHEYGSSSSYFTCLGTTAACSQPGAPRSGSLLNFSNNRKGPTAGAGIEFKTAHRWTITPEVRYVHLDQPRGNQVTAMVGFTFGK